MLNIFDSLLTLLCSPTERERDEDGREVEVERGKGQYMYAIYFAGNSFLMMLIVLLAEIWGETKKIL